jgi:hypothetical protein
LRLKIWDGLKRNEHREPEAKAAISDEIESERERGEESPCTRRK